MRSYLSSLPNYSASKFQDDINHIATHKIQNPEECKQKDAACIHFQRAMRDRNSVDDKDIIRKKALFKTNKSHDFIYISMLDRAHVILRHAQQLSNFEQKQILDFKFKDDVERVEMDKIPTYSTGVFIEYHS